MRSRSHRFDGVLADAEPVASEALRREMARLWPLLGRHIAFHRRLVDLTRDVKAALLLSQSIYWTRHGRDVAERGGWFHKTADQWDRETGLSAKEQAHARECLRRLALLDEQRAGLPARLHFRLDLERLAVQLSEVLGLRPDAWDWRDHAELLRRLGPSHAYHRVLAGVTGGVLPALLLSRGLTLARARLLRASDLWFTRVGGQWSDELGLSRREQEAARHGLVRLGLWEERGGRGPAVRQARVRLDVLRERLFALSANVRRASPEGGSPVRGIASISDARFGESSLRQSRNPDSTIPPPQIRPNRHHSFDETAIAHIRGTTGSSLQPLQPEAADMGDAHVREERGGGDLIFPAGLQPEERIAAGALVSRCPGQAQALLDELAARLQAHAVTVSPVAYLRGLVTRAMAGTFVPEAGLRIAALRRASSDADNRAVSEAIRGRDDAETRRRLDAHRAALREALRAAQAKGRPP